MLQRPLGLLCLTVLLAACQTPTAPAPASATPTPPPVMNAAPLPEVNALVQQLATQDGAQDASADMRMLIAEADGQRAQLEFRLQRQYTPAQTATLIKVTAPRAESDKALLAIEKPGAPTTAVSYLAGLKKFGRLGSSNQVSFRDAKVTVQELLGLELRQYEFGAAERLTEDGQPLFKATGKAKPESQLAFPRLVAYFNADTQQPVRFELLNDRDEVQKRAVVEELKPIQGRRTITKLTFYDVPTKRLSTIETRAIKYDQKLPAKLFTEDHLKSVITAATQQISQ